MNLEKVNILVCSSDLKPDLVQRLANSQKPLIIVTSDWFYPNERAQFEKIFPIVSFRCFNYFLSDKDLERCDSMAIEQCSPWVSSENYFGQYVEAIKYFKCEMLVQSFKKAFKHYTLYYQPSCLGISTSLFKNIKSKNVNDLTFSIKDRYFQVKHNLKIQLFSDKKSNLNEISEIKPAVPNLRKFLAKVDVLNFENKYFVILGGLKRLKNRKGILLFSGEINFGNWQNELATLLPELNNSLLSFGVELHQFKYEYTHFFDNVSVIADSYWPPNYGFSFHGIYPDKWQFACLSEPDKLFCEQAKLLFNQDFNFLYSPLFILESKLVKKEKNKKTVVLLSQCTSEWTALINRSDAALFVEAFVNQARIFPSVNFIIRPHPQMTLDVHDGPKSIERIKNFVDELNLANLIISKNTIQEDLEVGDIFITEYSTTAFEAMALGKIWISCNLTKRRNYFEYFTQLGFLHAETEIELNKLIDKLILDDSETIENFNLACSKYKQLLK